ncbi:integral membrane [Pyrenophora seminiperda CCB06]|uniref:Integral membrane n=1 Tax=Pyrenophora seminiperda CCB06 TaxID=1302712 RepID=A0A3M7MJE3_9PLEO|nr:integral membrane [Pyrenophora seminiperda CCB06]
MTWFCFLLGILSCLLRVYSCVFVKHAWKADDYLGLLVLASLVGALYFWQTALMLGCGNPPPNKCNYLDPGEKLVEYLYVLGIYYSLIHFIIKSTFLAFYLRLSPNRVFHLWTGVGFGLNVGSLIVNLLILVFQCIPVSAALHILARLRATCMDRNFVLIAPAVVNVLLDIYVFILPIPILVRLQMPTKRKLGVLSVFLFGGGAVIMSIIRFHSVVFVQSLNNTSKNIGEVMIVVALELNLAAIAVNLPAIRAIWVHRQTGPKGVTGSKGGLLNGISKRQTYTVSHEPHDVHEMGRAGNATTNKSATSHSFVSRLPLLSSRRAREDSATEV